MNEAECLSNGGIQVTQKGPADGKASTLPNVSPWRSVRNGDARYLLPQVPSESVDLFLTSPPYADLKDYGSPRQIGFGQSFEEYLHDMQDILKLSFNAARPSATLWLVSDSFKKNGQLINLPAELARCATEVGWKLQDIVIWHKAKTLPWSHRGHLRKIFEYIYVFAKSKQYKYYSERIREIDGLQEWWVKYPERYNSAGRAPHAIWHFPIPTQGSWGNGAVRHFNPFPPELVERIIELTTDEGDVVFDPFAGSGTVLAQADCMGRIGAGIELNPYFTDSLFPKVLAQARRTWEVRTQLRAERDRKVALFDSLIMRMRKIKLSKQVLKRLCLSEASSQVGPFMISAGVLVDQEDRTTQQAGLRKWDPACLLLVGQEIDRAEDAVAYAMALCKTPPYSKYGVDLHIAATTPAALSHEAVMDLTTDRPWFVYLSSTTLTYTDTVSNLEVAQFCHGPEEHPWKRDGVPPLFSGIAVSSEEVRDLRRQLSVSNGLR